EVGLAGPFAQDALAGVVVAHPLRIADQLHVVHGHRQRPGELARRGRARDAPPRPRTVLVDQEQRRLGDRGPRLHAPRPPFVRRRPRAQVLQPVVAGRSARAEPSSRQSREQAHPPTSPPPQRTRAVIVSRTTSRRARSPRMTRWLRRRDMPRPQWWQPIGRGVLTCPSTTRTWSFSAGVPAATPPRCAPPNWACPSCWWSATSWAAP